MTLKNLLLLLALLSTTLTFSQNDEDLIRHSIHNYFSGTSYSYIPLIKSAFYEGAELYLENSEGKLVKMTAEEYAALFEKNEPGQFIGRYNKILSIDIEGNLAQVKAEILMPARNRRYTDIFIMKKLNQTEWKIISKAANSTPMTND